MPLLLVLLLGEDDGPVPAAAAVFGIAALTDAADGHIARSRDMVTTFGRIADPLADKLLVGTALASLVVLDRLALWIALVIGLREAGVALLRGHAGRQGIVLHVSSLGKAKTCLADGRDRDADAGRRRRRRRGSSRCCWPSWRSRSSPACSTCWRSRAGPRRASADELEVGGVQPASSARGTRACSRASW